MIDAPLRLYLKTKDPLAGSASGLWFSNHSTEKPSSLLGGFEVPRRLRGSVSLVGVVRAFETERESGKGERCEAFSDCRSGSLVWRADDARGTAQGRGTRGGLQAA